MSNDNLEQIIAELGSADFSNKTGPLSDHPAFQKLEQLAGMQREKPYNSEDTLELNAPSLPEEPFHIEADVYDSGDYLNLLVIPCGLNHIVVADNEHLATLLKTCDDPACWEQLDGNLDEEVVEKLGASIDSYWQSFLY